MSDYSPDLLNYALQLATEWGESFRKPINERLIVKLPGLSDTEIAEITDIVRAAEYKIYALAERELAGEITEGDITRLAHEEIPWITDDHALRLKTIGMYYARR